MIVLVNPLFIIAALVCAFMSHRVAGRIALLSFVLTTAPIPLSVPMCVSSQRDCYGWVILVPLFIFGGAFLGALIGMLWQARRSLQASDLRQIPGWQAPSETVRATYLATLAAVALTTLVNLPDFLFPKNVVGNPGDAAGDVSGLTLYCGLASALLLFACAFRARCILAQPDALWLPATGVRRRIAYLAAMSVGTLLLAAPLVGKHVPTLKLDDEFASGATEGGWLSIFLGLCAFELSRAKALRKAHSIEA